VLTQGIFPTIWNSFFGPFVIPSGPRDLGGAHDRLDILLAECLRLAMTQAP
jgi:hypothetical protein